MTIRLCLLSLGLTVPLGQGVELPAVPTPAPAHSPRPTLSAVDSARHVLLRLAWGPTPGEIDRVAEGGVDRWIETQLEVTAQGDPALADEEAHRVSLTTPTTELVQLYRDLRSRRGAADSTGEGTKEKKAASATELRTFLTDYGLVTLTRQTRSTQQLREVLAAFWSNHFNVLVKKGQDRILLRDHIESAIRPHIFGTFEELLLATAHSPAMLHYLDNATSVAARPSRGSRPARGINENYARELLELHTLGVDGGYTQADIIAVARALTGWGIDPRSGQFRFSPALHDRGEKVILGVRFPPGGGEEEGRRVLHLLATHPSTIRHLSTKLCALLVSDDAPPSCVAAATRAWKAHDGNLREVVRAIVADPSFWAEAQEPSKVKSPHEFLVSALRALDIDPSRAPRLLRALDELGQPLFGATAPTGWPERASDWMSSSTLLARMNTGLALVQGDLPGLRLPSGGSGLARGQDAPQLLARLDHDLFGNTLSETTRHAIMERIAPLSNPADARTTALGLVLGSPDFQRQ